MKRWIAVAFMLIALCLAAIYALSKPASAQAQICGPFKSLVDQLAAQLNETVVLTGYVADKQVVVTMSSSGNFAVLIAEGGVACLIIAGDKAELDKGT